MKIKLSFYYCCCVNEWGLKIHSFSCKCHEITIHHSYSKPIYILLIHTSEYNFIGKDIVLSSSSHKHDGGIEKIAEVTMTKIKLKTDHAYTLVHFQMV